MKFRLSSYALAVAFVASACAGAATQPPEPASTAEPEPAATAEATAEPTADASADPAPTAEPSAEPTASAEPEPEPGSLRARIMRAHFKETVVIRNAVIAGRLHAATKPARKLANMEGIHTLPKNWRTAMHRLNKAAKRISESADLQESAAATADIGLACGACHAAGVGPKPKIGEAPAGAATMKARMERHKWATERMWEGLYVPSDAAWQAGVAALQMDAFPKSDLSKGGVHALSSASRFNKFVGEAKSASTPTKRAAVYASILATCSPCHNAMGL